MTKKALLNNVIFCGMCIVLFLIFALTKNKIWLINLGLIVIIMTMYNIKLSMRDFLIILLPVMFYIRIPFEINVSMADLLLVILIVKIVLSKNYTFKIDKRALNTINVYGISIIGVMLLSVINLFRWEANLLRAIVAIIKIVICILYANVVMIWLLKGGKKAENKFLKISTYSTLLFCIVAIMGVILYQFGIDLGISFAYRATGTFEDPNLAAAYIIIMFGFVGVYMQKNKLISIVTLCLMIITLLLTASKSALVSVIGTSAIYFIIIILKCDIKRMLKYIIFIMMLICIIIFFKFNPEYIPTQLVPSLTRLQELSVGLDTGGSHRSELWKSTLKLGLENPILGVGVEHFRVVSGLENVAHNTYLSFFSEMGLLGLSALIMLPIKLLISLINNLNYNKENKYLLLSLIGIMIFMFAINLQNFRVLWVFLAYIVYKINQMKYNSLK